MLGCAFIVFFLSVSRASYGPFLLGAENKDLSWGPALFRGLLAFHGILLIVFGWTRNQSGSSSDKTNGSVSEVRTSPTIIGFLIGLSVLALVLRLWNLNSDLWLDEVLTLLDFVRYPVGHIVTSFPSQNQHMLFSLLAKLTTTVFGESAWALRLPSVVFGIGSIWAFFYLGRKLLGQKEALLGCALLTVSYHHIWFSQNARGYMGFYFSHCLRHGVGSKRLKRMK